MPLHLLGISRSDDLHRWDAGCAPASRDGATVPRSSRCETASELDRNGVRWVVESELSAATVLPLPPPDGALKHAALLAAIHRHGDILPVRFAVVLPREEAVRDLLRRRRVGLLRDLDRLKGTAEIGLRIELPHSPGPPDPPLPSGSRHPGDSPLGYLAARRARYQWQDDLNHRVQLAAETCVRAVKGLYRSWGRLSPEPPGTVRLAFLVERHLLKAFADRLEMSPARAIGQQRTLLGPWPPYSFV